MDDCKVGIMNDFNSILTIYRTTKFGPSEVVKMLPPRHTYYICLGIF